MSIQKKILVVDDDEAVLDFLQAKLGANYAVIATNAPERVVPLAKEHSPDLIICDVDMPDMDGGDVSAALWADDETRSIPTLFLTALASPPEIAAARGQIAGRAAMSKRSSSAELLARIKAMVEG
ncbi:MAG: response regulator [Betaproteobacteria bacterium]|nr:response regulator [Betaproteobacteria bacterium]